MGSACHMYEEGVHTGFWWGNLMEVQLWKQINQSYQLNQSINQLTIY